MLTLDFSEEGIQRLKYEKDFNPRVRLRKRSYAVYLKMSQKTGNITAEAIVEFLQRLRTRYGQKQIAIVMDNARYQHCQIILDKAKEINIKILFLPPYSPNLNIIERLWKFTKKKILYGKYYENPRVFHEEIRTFFEQIN